MTRIEEALKRLQREAPGRSSAKGASAPAAGSAVASADKKKVTRQGAKHHVSESDLMGAGLLAAFDQSGHVADEFRKIKRPLIANALGERSETGEAMNVIMIASALPGAGKTFCSVNLAVSMSLERDLNVLLVDADIAKPHISREFGLGGVPGLIDLLIDDSLDVADLLVRTDLNDIQLLPAGRGHEQATELLASDKMLRLVRELSTRYPDRIILLDSPPLLATTEAQALAAHVGQIALVVEAGRTSEQMLSQALATLDRRKAINLILNKTQQVLRSGYHGEEYGYYPNAK